MSMPPSRVTILFVRARPRDWSLIDPDTELRNLKISLREAEHLDMFEVESAEIARQLFDALGASQETERFVGKLDKIPDDLTSNPLLLTLLAALWHRTPVERRGICNLG